MMHKNRILFLFFLFSLVWFSAPVNAAPTNIWQAAFFNNTDLSGDPVVVTEIAQGSDLALNWWTDRPHPDVPKNNFSLRLERSLYFPQTGTYCFNTKADDGARLFVDGVLLVDAWENSRDKVNIAGIDLSAGNHFVRVEYVERGGDANLFMRWKGLKKLEGALSADSWRGSYFSTTSPSGCPTLVRQDSDIQFDWGNNPPADDLPKDNFSVRWQRQIVVPKSETYCFVTKFDQGLRLQINGKTFIDSWEKPSARPVAVPIQLTAGTHYAQVDYRDERGDAFVSLDYYPLSQFYSRPAPTNRWEAWYYNEAQVTGCPVVLSHIDQGSNLALNWWTNPPHPDVAKNNFAVRLMRSLYFPATGQYCFRSKADDGVRVYVDDVLLIDAWEGARDKENRGGINLSSGSHVVRVEFREAGGDAYVYLNWQSLESLLGPLSADFWRGRYFDSPTPDGCPVFARADQQIAFDWETESADERLPKDDFSIRWERQIAIPKTDNYCFVTRFDHGLRFSLDGKKLIDAWDTPSRFATPSLISLSAGNHFAQVDYHDERGPALIEFNYFSLGDLYRRAAPTTAWEGWYYNADTPNGCPVLVKSVPKLDFLWEGSPEPSVQANNFATAWRRTLEIPRDGRYRFVVQADDGVRVWLDDALVIDGWEGVSGQFLSYDAPLTQGRHVVRVEHYDKRGTAKLQFNYYLLDGVQEQTAWFGQYFNNANLTGQPALMRQDPHLKFNWGEGSPHAQIDPDSFSARWTRDIVVANDAIYRFAVKADDGSQVWVDGELVIDAWQDEKGNWVEVELPLQAGVHSLQVAYYERNKSAEIEFIYGPR